MDNLIAPPSTPDIRDTAAPDGEHFPSLRAARNREDLRFLVQGGHLNLRSQRRLGKGNGHLAMDVGTVPLEEFVGLYRNHHIEITRRAAIHAFFAFAN